MASADFTEELSPTVLSLSLKPRILFFFTAFIVL